MIITPFSMRVALVMGSFIAVPRQAHCIFSLRISVLRTPKEVALNIIRVETSAKNNSILLRNINPRRVSING